MAATLRPTNSSRTKSFSEGMGLLLLLCSPLAIEWHPIEWQLVRWQRKVGFGLTHRLTLEIYRATLIVGTDIAIWMSGIWLHNSDGVVVSSGS